MWSFMSNYINLVILPLIYLVFQGCVMKDNKLQVEIVAPRSGATVAGFVSIRPKIVSSGDISHVRYFIDGKQVRVDNFPPFDFEWSSEGLADGNQHSIYVEVTDASGFSRGASCIVTIPEKSTHIRTPAQTSAAPDNMSSRSLLQSDYQKTTPEETQPAKDKKHKNTPPKVVIYSKTLRGTPSTVFEFDASESSDLEDENSQLKVRWDWDNNGIWDTEYSQNKIAHHQFNTEGYHTIKIEIKDQGGLISSRILVIKISPASIIQEKVQEKEKEVKIVATKIPSVSPERTELIFIRGGMYDMGDHFGDGLVVELPVHSVTLSDFKLGAKEVTISQYLAFLNDSDVDGRGSRGTEPLIDIKDSDCPIKFNGMFYFKPTDLTPSPEYPISEVTWYGALEYCNWLSRHELLSPCYSFSDGKGVKCDWSSKGYRLPTEAEWEYAARSRGRQDRKYSGTNKESEVIKYAWYSENSELQLNIGGELKANDLGLFDMSGNAWEWCWESINTYKKYENTNPHGYLSRNDRVVRGGSFGSPLAALRTSNRHKFSPETSNGRIGFRIAQGAH